MKLERPSSDLSKTVSNIIFGQNLHILEYVEVTVPKSWDLGTVTSTHSKMCKICPKMTFETVLERSSDALSSFKYN